MFAVPFAVFLVAAVIERVLPHALGAARRMASPQRVSRSARGEHGAKTCAAYAFMG